MGRILLVVRLVLGDIRRHPAHAGMLVLSIAVATTMLSLGVSLHGVADRLYLQTRAVTAGPDLVAVVPGTDRATISRLTALQDLPGVVDHSGPYRHFFTELTAHGVNASAVVHDADSRPDSLGRPLVTSGSWVRPGGIVVERGFATALNVHVGDQVAVAGRPFPVAGIAVTAAHIVYPWAQMGGPDGGPSDHAGLVWMNEPDTRALTAAGVPASSMLYLKLNDPDATQAFQDSSAPTRTGGTNINIFRWQFIAHQDSTLLAESQPILVIGGWLLSFLAIVGVSTLAAGRAAAQTRRVGLLKAVGATPGLIATVLFTEYLTLALLADALGLTAAWLVTPALVNPNGSLIASSTAPSGAVMVVTSVVALAVAMLTTLGPTTRALRTDTVAALADAAHQPRHRPLLARTSALLPIPLLIGLRLMARRPGRVLLHAGSTTATVAAIVVLLMVYAQPRPGWKLGSATVPDLQENQNLHLLLAVAVALIILALVNTLTITWTTATEARATMAVARTLGATPGQIAAGLSTAQLLPTLSGAIAGIPGGVVLLWPFGPDEVDLPPTGWLLTTLLALLLTTAVLTALPARIAARRSIAETLSAETA